MLYNSQGVVLHKTKKQFFLENGSARRMLLGLLEIDLKNDQHL